MCRNGICTAYPGYAGNLNHISVQSVYFRHDPYDQLAVRPLDLQGWFNTNDEFWKRMVVLSQPRLAIEVGVWKGRSTAVIATELKTQMAGGLVLAVDTFTGAPEFWTNDNDPERGLEIVNGWPTVIWTFMSNMKQLGLAEYVVPLPLPSLQAAIWVRKHDLWIDLIHIDGAHEYQMLLLDIQAWWPMVRVGGVMVGDDYDLEHWPEVVKVVNEFQAWTKLELHVDGVKWYFIKPNSRSQFVSTRSFI